VKSEHEELQAAKGQELADRLVKEGYPELLVLDKG
jgi:hypothetical protein